MATTFHRAKNRVAGALAPVVASGRAVGGATIVVDNAALLAVAVPFYVTAVRPGAVLPIFEITAVSGNTLTTSGPVGGLPDAALVAGDTLEMRATAEHVNELQDAVNALATSGGGDKTYVHNQLSPATVWTVTHGLGKYPVLLTFDSAGTWVIGDPHYVDLDTLTITFNAAIGGRAVLD